MNRNYEGGNKFNAAHGQTEEKKNLCTQSKKSVRYFMCVLHGYTNDVVHGVFIYIHVYMYFFTRPSYTTMYGLSKL